MGQAKVAVGPDVLDADDRAGVGPANPDAATVARGVLADPAHRYCRIEQELAAVGEETGFLGVVIVLGLYGVLLRGIFRTAKLASDRFGTLLAIGTFAMILVQVVQNVGMTIRVLPITGIPLPLVSYGGSSLLTSLIGLGLVQSVHRYRSGPGTSMEEPHIILDHDRPAPERVAVTQI